MRTIVSLTIAMLVIIGCGIGALIAADDSSSSTPEAVDRPCRLAAEVVTCPAGAGQSLRITVGGRAGCVRTYSATQLEFPMYCQSDTLRVNPAWRAINAVRSRITSECPPLVGATDGTASPTFCRDGRPNPPANAYFRPLGLATLESLGPSATFRSLLKALCGPVTKEGSFPIAGEDYALAAAKEGWPAAPGFDLTTVCRNPTAAEAENPPLLRVPPPPPARCDPGGNDLEMESCIAEQLIAADRQLNTEMTMIFEASTTYDATGQGLHPTLPSLAPGESIAEAIRLDFIASQKAWLVYEQDDCSGEAQPNDGGTIQPQVVGDCLLQLDSHRLSDLRAYYQALLPG